MKYSLLAHLYPHIRGSQEDIATLSLQYLLSQSNSLNMAFTNRIAKLMEIELDNTLQYICQVTGEGDEMERPDMSGIDSNGKEVMLFEMKFYASLTANQPLTYIERLKNNRGKGLLFVCPSSRITPLWFKIRELCEECEIQKVNKYCIKVDGINLAIITWGEIIERLKDVASFTDNAFSSDIAQLEGYCNQLDSEAFIPFSATDLSSEMARKGERYYQIVDEVMELICAEDGIETSKKGLKATGYRKGYTRSLYIDDFTISFNYARDMWLNPSCVDTPFWVAIRDGDWDQPESFYKEFDKIPEVNKQMYWGLTFIALEPLQNATFPEVCEDLKNQILNLINSLR